MTFVSMSADRERQFKALVKEFPDSPMGHFSLGKFYLDGRRYAEAAASLKEAVRLDAGYAAAWVALGDAEAGCDRPSDARASYERARTTPLGQRDASLQDDIDRRLAELDG